MAPVAILIGPPGAGKTTIGMRLARALRVDFADSDVEIEKHAGATIPEIFSTLGEPAFRQLEEDVIAQLFNAHRGVVSLGGGAVLSALTRERARGHQVVYLELTTQEGVRRTAHSDRPLLAGDNPAARYEELMSQRTPLYRELATIRVSTVGRGPGSVVRQIQRRLRDTSPRPVQHAPWPKLPAILRTPRDRHDGGDHL